VCFVVSVVFRLMNTINAEEEETIIFFFFKHGGRRTTHTLPPLQLAALHVLPPHQRECRVHNQDMLEAGCMNVEVGDNFPVGL